MDGIKIKTDHKWRNFLYANEVPESVLASDFDYQDREETIDGFIKYRNRYFHLDQFMRLDSGDFALLGWQARADDTAFSCYLLKVSDDGEQYQIAFAYC